jgi:hypothetical protein
MHFFDFRFSMVGWCSQIVKHSNMTIRQLHIFLFFLIIGSQILRGSDSAGIDSLRALTTTDSESEALQINFLHPLELSVEEGGTLILEARIQGEIGSTVYRWETPVGTINSPSPKLVFPLATSFDEGVYTLTVSDAEMSTSASVVVSVVLSPPDAPSSSTAVIPNGDTVYLRVGHLPAPSRSWSWFLNGRPLPKGSLGIFPITNVSFDRVGTYELVQFNPTETIYSITLVIAESKLTNLSIRDAIGAENNSTTLGFVTTGQPDEHQIVPTLLLRSVGPTLSEYGVLSPLLDPIMDVYSIGNSGEEPTLIAQNNNWSEPIDSNVADNATAQTMRDLGAFDLIDDSNDAALVLRQRGGAINTMVSSGKLGTGIVLNEIYLSEAELITLTNASVLSETGTNEETLIVGFVVTGEWPLRLLIRGIGPGLANHGVSEPVPNPKLNLFDSKQVLLHNNDNWGHAHNSEEIRTESARVGAFPIADGSNDAVILEALLPGSYTVHLEAVSGIFGPSLVEIYVVR